jgi:hypothetical protein
MGKKNNVCGCETKKEFLIWKERGGREIGQVWLGKDRLY